MNICVIATNYPSDGYPKHVFLEKIVKEFVDLGHKCTVIAPQSNAKVREYKKLYKTDKGNEYFVYSPRYVNFSGKRIGILNLGSLTNRSFTNAVDNCYINNAIECDVFYSHFLSAGLAANYMSGKYGKPFFMANGESKLADFIETLSKKKVRATYDRVSAIISVSTANKEETINSGYFNKTEVDKIHVLPNGINPEIFYPENRELSRKKLGIDNDKFIVIFVGQFSERKGSKRVAEALNYCQDVYSIFIGAGPEEPNHEKCLLKGKVDNSKIRIYLSAADVFVLPTQNEGCCNAIVEALACGLPVISSNKPFNFDILDSKCGVLIDPDNVNEIANAIIRLKNDPDLRAKMSINSISKARDLTLKSRAEKILHIMSLQ